MVFTIKSVVIVPDFANFTEEQAIVEFLKAETEANDHSKLRFHFNAADIERVVKAYVAKRNKKEVGKEIPNRVSNFSNLSTEG